MRLVIVTGMSGAGKSTALKMLEDMGYFCVDNLPISLIGKFAELIYSSTSEISKVALGLDIRSGKTLDELTSTLEKLTMAGYKYEILFLDASDEVLVKRYKETRRNHPLAQEGGDFHPADVLLQRGVGAGLCNQDPRAFCQGIQLVSSPTEHRDITLICRKEDGK